MHGLAILEKNERGNRDDAKPRGKVGLFVNVALANGEKVVHLFGNLLHDGAERTAWAAP